MIATIDSSTDLVMVGMLDSLSLKNTKLGLETLELMGYDPNKIQLVLNRAHSRVGISQSDVGRRPRPRAGRVRAERPRDPARGQRGRADRRRPPRVGCARRRSGASPNCSPATDDRARSRARQRTSGFPPLSEGGHRDGTPRATRQRHPRRPVRRRVQEPFADLKNQIHMRVISELGPQLTGRRRRPDGLRDRVIADIRSTCSRTRPGSRATTASD